MSSGADRGRERDVVVAMIVRCSCERDLKIGRVVTISFSVIEISKSNLGKIVFFNEKSGYILHFL